MASSFRYCLTGLAGVPQKTIPGPSSFFLGQDAGLASENDPWAYQRVIAHADLAAQDCAIAHRAGSGNAGLGGDDRRCGQ